MQSPTPMLSPRKLLALAAPSLIAVGFIGAVLATGADVALLLWLERIGDSAIAAPLAILAFAVFASVGVPQFVLIPALVAAFGPWGGFFYSWIGRMFSCAFGFAIGRRFGAAALREGASAKTMNWMDALARNGFWASALVRMAPGVPSFAVNIAAGCTPIRFKDFMAGTALGSVPKMALIAFAGHAAIEGVDGGGAQAWFAFAAAIVLLWCLFFAARRWLNPAGATSRRWWVIQDSNL